MCVTSCSRQLHKVSPLTEYVDHADRPAEAHESRQPQHHLLSVGGVLLLLLVIGLFSLPLTLTSLRRRLALDKTKCHRH